MFARLDLENGKSYERSISKRKHRWPFGYKMHCSDSL